MTEIDLVITAFLLLVIDRLAVLYIVSVKAGKALKRDTGAKGRRELLKQALVILHADYGLILAATLLVTLLLLGWMQIDDRELIGNRVGQIAFASVGFLLSITGSMMNLCIEFLDRD